MFGIGMTLWTGGPVISASPPWTPLSLGSALVAWYDFSDATTMFTNTIATVNVATNGDEIQRINDKSGNGFYCIINGGAGTGAVYNTGGYGTFNGTTQRLVSNSTTVPIATAAGYSAGAATYFANNTGVQSVVDADNLATTRLAQLLRNNANAAESIAFNTAVSAFTDAAGTAITATAAHVMVNVTSTSAVECFLDGTSNGSTAITGTIQTTNTVLTLGGTNQGSSPQFLNGRIYQAIIVNRPLTSGERASMTTWLGSKCGLVL